MITARYSIPKLPRNKYSSTGSYYYSGLTNITTSSSGTISSNTGGSSSGNSSAGSSVDLSGYATQQWIYDQEFAKISDLNGYATQQWIYDQGYIKSGDITGFITEDYVDNKLLNDTSNFVLYNLTNYYLKYIKTPCTEYIIDDSSVRGIRQSTPNYDSFSKTLHLFNRNVSFYKDNDTLYGWEGIVIDTSMYGNMKFDVSGGDILKIDNGQYEYIYSHNQEFNVVPQRLSYDTQYPSFNLYDTSLNDTFYPHEILRTTTNDELQIASPLYLYNDVYLKSASSNLYSFSGNILLSSNTTGYEYVNIDLYIDKRLYETNALRMYVKQGTVASRKDGEVLSDLSDMYYYNVSGLKLGYWNNLDISDPSASDIKSVLHIGEHIKRPYATYEEYIQSGDDNYYNYTAVDAVRVDGELYVLDDLYVKGNMYIGHDTVSSYIDNLISDYQTSVNSSFNQINTSINDLYINYNSVNTSISELRSNINTSIIELQTNTNTSINDLQTHIDTSINYIQTHIDTSIDNIKTQINTNKNLQTQIDASLDSSINQLYTDTSNLSGSINILGSAVDGISSDIVRLNSSLSDLSTNIYNAIDASFNEIISHLDASLADITTNESISIINSSIGYLDTSTVKRTYSYNTENQSGDVQIIGTTLELGNIIGYNDKIITVDEYNVQHTYNTPRRPRYNTAGALRFGSSAFGNNILRTNKDSYLNFGYLTTGINDSGKYTETYHSDFLISNNLLKTAEHLDVSIGKTLHTKELIVNGKTLYGNEYDTLSNNYARVLDSITEWNTALNNVNSSINVIKQDKPYYVLSDSSYNNLASKEPNKIYLVYTEEY